MNREVAFVIEMYEHKCLHRQSTKKSEVNYTNKVRKRLKVTKKERDHLHVGLDIRELTSAEELVSLGGNVASDARTTGRTLLE